MNITTTMSTPINQHRGDSFRKQQSMETRFDANRIAGQVAISSKWMHSLVGGNSIIVQQHIHQLSSVVAMNSISNQPEG